MVKDRMKLRDIKETLGVPMLALNAKVVVTPEQAKRLLDGCNRQNRKLNDDHVETLRRDMESGNWYQDVDYIGFNQNGVLVNGQHRLAALAGAHVDHVTLKFDFDVEQHLSMDTGLSRTYSDLVRLNRKLHPEQLMPNKYRPLITTGLRINNRITNLSNSELTILWSKMHEMVQAAEEHHIFDVGPKPGVVVKSSMLWAAFSGVDLDLLKHFAEVLKTGITTAKTDIPIIRFRDELADLRGTGKDKAMLKAAYTQQCIFDVVNGSISNRLPTKPLMHYCENDAIKYLIECIM